MKITIWHKLGQIKEGYTALIFERLGFGNDKVKKLADYRRIVINNTCGCTKYYINFLGIKLIPYLSCCGCVKEAKIRCENCHCIKGFW